MTNNCPDRMCGADDCTRCRPADRFAPQAYCVRCETFHVIPGTPICQDCYQAQLDERSDRMFEILQRMVNPNRATFRETHQEDLAIARALVAEILEACQ